LSFLAIIDFRITCASYKFNTHEKQCQLLTWQVSAVCIIVASIVVLAFVNI